MLRWLLNFAPFALIILCTLPAGAQNYPCSGMKGGIDHCAGSIFICNDGTASASKKDCQKYIGLYKGTGSTDDDTSKPSPRRKKPATDDNQ